MGFLKTIREFFAELWQAFAADYSDRLEESYPLHARNPIDILHGAIGYLHRKQRELVFLHGDFAVHSQEYADNGIAILFLEAKLSYFLWAELGLLPGRVSWQSLGENDEKGVV